MENSKNWRKREVWTADKRATGVTTLAFLSLMFFSCTPHIRVGVVGMTAAGSAQADSAAAMRDSLQRVSESIDFGTAFDTTITADSVAEQTTDTAPTPEPEPAVRPVLFPPFSVSSKKVRVALMRDVGRAVLYSAATVTLQNGHSRQRFNLRGRVLVESKTGDRTVTVSTAAEKFRIALPCTLKSGNGYNFFEIGDAAYRGDIIIVASRNAKFIVINYLDVEEYLRGVLPIEMGKRPAEEIEALKAQAVAARTYTYRRIAERSGEPYDCVSTVADQVYGGSSVEYREADIAVRATADLVMTSGGSVVNAYYHSTCGGMTADVHEAWGKPKCPYLQPVSDINPQTGVPYCISSAWFAWEERWNTKRFSTIVTRSLQKLFPSKRFSAPVNRLAVEERFSCGRVKRLCIEGNGWKHDCGADRTRFIMRRDVAGEPILRSSNFEILSGVDRQTVVIRGKGYGHGVGMCQMGAIGRARAGQNFVTILTSYYKGVVISTATAQPGGIVR